MFRKGKYDKVCRIIEVNLDYLVRFAYYRVGNRAEAEDIVYEAVLRFLGKSPENISEESVRLYLFRTVHNLCLDRARRTGKDLLPIDGIDIEDTAEDIADMEDADRINACLDSLPAREADIIRMNVVDNLSFVEISGILSIPQSTAKSRYKAGMDKLRKLFMNDKMS